MLGSSNYMQYFTNTLQILHKCKVCDVENLTFEELKFHNFVCKADMKSCFFLRHDQLIHSLMLTDLRCQRTCSSCRRQHLQ